MDKLLIRHKSHKLTVGGDDNIWKLVTELMRAPAVTPLDHKCQFPLLLNHSIVFQGFLHCVWTLNSAITIIPLHTAVCWRITVKITVLIMTSPFTSTTGFLLKCPCPFQFLLNPKRDKLVAFIEQCPFYFT